MYNDDPVTTINVDAMIKLNILLIPFPQYLLAIAENINDTIPSMKKKRL
jgi:hypothetical protein